MSRQEFYEKCRKEYPIFTYKGFSFNLKDQGLNITFDFSINGLSEFHPTWFIPIINQISFMDQNLLDELIFSLGMVELISYWKISCPSTVIINNRKLSSNQIDWWKKLYWYGLGEFYYTNGIKENQDSFMSINCLSEKQQSYTQKLNDNDNHNFKPDEIQRILIPVGGGKDSIVTIELLKDKADIYCYIINSRGATNATVEVADLSKKTIYAKRTLDKNMLELNKKGFLNGHTPFSAIVAFSSIIAGYLNAISFVALSNESSANESTIKGSYINHQYSKSFEFEKDFNYYEKIFIKSGVNYFSFLRPINELQIAMLFSRLKKYHRIFKSCNVGSKQDIWCCHCSKCLFVYIILSPFLSLKELDEIFGKRLLEDETLINDFDKLCGIISEKPFECVGSIDEVNASINVIVSKYENEGIKFPKLLLHYKELEIANDLSFEKIISQYSNEHGMNKYFENIIKEALKQK